MLLGVRVFDTENSILFCLILFEHYLKSYFEKRGKKWSHKIIQVDLNSSRRELFVRGLKFVVALWIFGKLILYVRLLRVQSSRIHWLDLVLKWVGPVAILHHSLVVN